MGVTTNFSFPYPSLTDAPDGPSQIQALAEAVDAELETVVAGLPYPVVTVFKAADTSRAETVTPAADPDLSVAIAASATYKIDAYLNYEGGTEGDSDLQIVMHSVGSLRYECIHGDSSGTIGVGTSYAGGATVVLGTDGAASLRAASLRGTVINASGAGTLYLAWAQDTSSATDTILHAGSWLSVQRIA